MKKHFCALLVFSLVLFHSLGVSANGVFDFYADFEDNQSNSSFTYNGALAEYKMEFGRNCYKVRSNKPGELPAGIQKSFSTAVDGKILLEA